MDNTKLANQLKKFEEHMMVYRGISQVTVGGYCRALSICLRRLRKFVPQHSDIEGYILWMHKEQYSYSHIVNTSLALEHYMNFKGEPIKLGRPKKPRRIIKDHLSESEVSRLIQSAKNIRQKAVVTLLAYSGIRNSEFCNLKIEDINLGANQVRIVQGKNKKDRVVNIAAECTNVIIEYLKAFPRQTGEYLFTTLKRGAKFATGDLRKTLCVLKGYAGITKRVWPHLMRHSLATSLLNRGMSLIAIKEQMGHAFIESTMIYAVSMPFRVKSEYDHFKPAYL